MEKINIMLSDENTYEACGANPINKLESTSNSLVNQLFGGKVIDDIRKKRMTKHNTQIARIYALPKVHKEDAPLRPIVSIVNSQAAKLSKYMDGILKNIIHNNYDVRNSREMKNRLTNISIGPNNVLVSFDVVSLFPSIPIDTVFNILKAKWQLIEEHTTMPRRLFFDILRFVLIDSTYFDFDGHIYNKSTDAPWVRIYPLQ